MSQFLLATVAWQVRAQLGLPELPAEISLPFTIRDFKQDHPDFQRSGTRGFSFGLDKGITKSLDDDRKPVYAKSTKGTIDSAASFKEWFTDVPAKNKVFQESLKLKRKGKSNIYSFCSTKFFPLDDKTNAWPLSAKEKPHKHKFWFTSEWHGTFDYTASGERFSFSGDDDCWVFIDGVLIMDLGGVHGRMDKTVILKDVKGSNGAALTKGKKYKIDVFHAERHTTGSNFCMETSINIDKPEKECDADKGKSCGYMSFGMSISIMLPLTKAWEKFNSAWDWGLESYKSEFDSLYKANVEGQLSSNYKKTNKKARKLSGSFEVSFSLDFEISVISKDTTVLGAFQTLLCALLRSVSVSFKCEWISVRCDKATEKFRRLAGPEGRRLAEKVDMGYDIAVPSDSGVDTTKAKEKIEAASPSRLTSLLGAAAPKALTDKYGKPEITDSRSPDVSSESDMEVVVEKSAGEKAAGNSTNKSSESEVGSASGIRVPIAMLILGFCALRIH